MNDVRVVMHKATVDKLNEAIAEGLYDGAEDGMQRSLEHARSKFKTIRRFQSNAFASGFNESGGRIGAEGDAPNRIDAGDRGKPVAYFGYQWFVARFYETGTARQSPRPTVAPALADIAGSLPGTMRQRAVQKGFR